MLLFTSISVEAQHTTPRFGTAGNQDNTYSRLNLGSVKIADTAGATPDTVLINPGSNSKVTGVYSNHYQLTLTDSCVLSISSLNSSWLWDEIVVDIENTSGSNHWVKFIGTWNYFAGVTAWGMSSTGTKISPTSGKAAILRFHFNGALWIEDSRSLQ